MTKEKMQPLDNGLFSLAENKELKCFDFSLKKKLSYSTEEVSGMLTLVNLLASKCSDKLRILSESGEEKSF